DRGDKDPWTLGTRTVLATLYLQMNRLPEAEREAQESYRGRLELLGKTNPFTLISQGNLARVYLAQGRRDKADPLVRDLRETDDLLRKRPYPPTIMTIGLVGIALLQQRDFVEAESFLRLFLDLTAKQPSYGLLRPAAESGLGACLLGQKKYDKAEPLLL